MRKHNQYSHSLPFPLVNSHSHSHEFSLCFYAERLSSGAIQITRLLFPFPWDSHRTHGNSRIMHTSTPQIQFGLNRLHARTDRRTQPRTQCNYPDRMTASCLLGNSRHRHKTYSNQKSKRETAISVALPLEAAHPVSRSRR